MRSTSLAFALLIAACSDDTSRLATLESQVPAAQGTASVAQANLDAEIANRKLADADGLAQAKAYADQVAGQQPTAALAQQLAAEVKARADGEAATLAAAQAFTTAAVAKVTVPPIFETHLIAPGGVDLGIYITAAIAWSPKLGNVDYGGFRAIRFDGADCSGNAYIDFGGASGNPMANVKFIGPKGTLWKQSGKWQQRVDGVSDIEFYMGKPTACQPNAGVIAVAYPVTETGDTATAYDPRDLSTETRQISP